MTALALLLALLMVVAGCAPKPAAPVARDLEVSLFGGSTVDSTVETSVVLDTFRYGQLLWVNERHDYIETRIRPDGNSVVVTRDTSFYVMTRRIR